MTTEEEDIGIKEFMKKGELIKGAYKYRYTDFIVNELDKEGQVVFHDNLYQAQQMALQEDLKNVYTNSQLDLAGLLDKTNNILSTEQVKPFYSWVHTKRSGDNTIDNTYRLNLDTDDKQNRTAIHQIVNQYYHDFESNTQQEQGNQYINVKYIKNKTKKKRFSNEEQHLEFTLFKRNIDSYSAINLLSQYLKKPFNFFGICGNKDKRGITSQKVSVFRCTKEELLKINTIEKINSQVQVSDFKYISKDHKLGLGSLKGNRFSIFLRFLTVDDNIIEQNVNNLKQNGFINYFGLQRFGSTDVRTHSVGKAIINRQFQQAFNLILSSCDKNEEIQKAKMEYIQDYDHDKLIPKLTYKNKLEKQLVLALKGNQKMNFKDAIMSMPRNSRELYPHAYQSYIWNMVSSERIRKWGRDIVVGDIVLDKDNNTDYETLKEDSTHNFKVLVKVLTQIDIDNKDYSIYDVLIPIIGSEVYIPQESISKTIIDEIMEKENIDEVEQAKAYKEFFLTGNYRQLVAQPIDFQSELLYFKQKDDDVLAEFYNKEENKGVSKEEGKYKGINIKFNLLKCQYATMLIRELTKMSTSFSLQQQINEEMQKLD